MTTITYRGMMLAMRMHRACEGLDEDTFTPEHLENYFGKFGIRLAVQYLVRREYSGPGGVLCLHFLPLAGAGSVSIILMIKVGLAWNFRTTMPSKKTCIVSSEASKLSFGGLHGARCKGLRETNMFHKPLIIRPYFWRGVRLRGHETCSWTSCIVFVWGLVRYHDGCGNFKRFPTLTPKRKPSKNGSRKWYSQQFVAGKNTN